MKELNEAQRNIIHILDVWANMPSEERQKLSWRQYFIDQILNLKGDGWEITLINRDAELPWNPFLRTMSHFTNGTARSTPLYFDEFKAYEKAQQDMAGYVREVK